MRTTINLPDALAEAVRQRAAEEGRSFTSLVEQGLRSVLEETAAGPDEPLPTYGTAGGRCLVDVADREELWAVLDGDGAR